MADVSIIDFGDGNGNRNVKDKNAARSSAIAPVEDGSTSSAAYSVGDYICRNGQLYKVTTAIAIGDVIGNNIQLTKVVDEFGGSGDNISLSDLTDVDITSPTDGQVLTYNGTTGKWGNQNPSGVAESVVGPVENGTTASQAYAVGEHFIRNDKFCTCISAIASGATLTLNTNYVEGTIAECIARQGTYSTTETEIGTWNGERLYCKLFFGTTSSSESADDLIPSGLSNITTRDITGILYGLTDDISIPVYNNANDYIFLRYRRVTNNIVIKRATFSNASYTICLKYTKNS